MSQTTVSLQPDDPGWRRAQGQLLTQQYSPDQLKAYVKQYGSPLLLLSIKSIKQQYATLQRLLPRVKHYYALKPLPHPEVVKALVEMGGYFDLATNGEVDVVRAAGVDPKRCVHSHPIKRPNDVQYALDFGNDTFVFENEYELIKHAAVTGFGAGVRVVILMVVTFFAGYLPAKLIVRRNTLDAILGR
jgi:diaminopimelate decarboxylase